MVEQRAERPQISKTYSTEQLQRAPNDSLTLHELSLSFFSLIHSLSICLVQFHESCSSLIWPFKENRTGHVSFCKCLQKTFDLSIDICTGRLCWRKEEKKWQRRRGGRWGEGNWQMAKNGKWKSELRPRRTHSFTITITNTCAPKNLWRKTKNFRAAPV